MRYLFTSFILALIAVSPLSGSETESIEEALQAIKTSGESADLYKTVTKEGKVEVKMSDDPSLSFDALWDGWDRVIYVNQVRAQSKGKLISSILFELHNAKSNSELTSLVNRAAKGILSKEEYVRRVEELEYSNIVSTANILNRGIEKGHFPADSQISVFHSFSNHYKLQQVHGHSQWLADQYDSINPNGKRTPYRGTLGYSNKLSPKEKYELVRFMVIKNGLESKVANEMTSNIVRVQTDLYLLANHVGEPEIMTKIYSMVF